MRESEILFTEMLDCDRMSLYQNLTLPLDKPRASFASAVLKRRIQGEPLQYILGSAEFMGLEFKVSPAVFIPRPETEILVEVVLKEFSALSYKLSVLKILDLGTGSGNIAISLAKYLPQAKIDAVDISKEALNLAKENAKLHNAQVNFIQGDLFSAYSLQCLAAYSLIVSNPPYIPTAEIAHLQPEIGYEPRIALDGGEDGLDFYRRLVIQAPDYLKDSGILIMEIGFGQSGAIKNLLQNSDKLRIMKIVKDYNNIERVIVLKKVSENG